MKPIDIENLILLKLRHTSGETLARIHRLLTPAQGKGLVWRQSASAVYRLERQGLVCHVGDELVAEQRQPLYCLTPEGRAEAGRLASMRPGVPVAPQSEGEMIHA